MYRKAKERTQEAILVEVTSHRRKLFILFCLNVSTFFFFFPYPLQLFHAFTFFKMLDSSSIPLFLSLLLLLSSTSRASPAPRATTTFPDRQTLSDFNSTIDGRLFAERPVEAVCFLKDPLYNSNACLDYQQNKTNDAWITEHFSSLEQTNWEACGYEDSCLHTDFSNGTCGQGSIARYAVHAQDASDVAKYVQFATKHKLKVRRDSLLLRSFRSSSLISTWFHPD